MSASDPQTTRVNTPPLVTEALNSMSGRSNGHPGTAAAEVTTKDALPPATTLNEGAYVVDSVLGQGGFGITYRGRDAKLGRAVAVKEFFPGGCRRNGSAVQPAGAMSSSDYEACRDRFSRETRLLARFNHPGIANVYDVFEENNSAYMVMEFLDGETLTKFLARRGGKLSPPDAMSIIRQMADALVQVHNVGLLHQDLKPENIIVCNEPNKQRPHEPRVVLVDFGAARELTSHHTMRHSVVLTPGYAPLEQYSQQAPRGPYTDVYALAATLYHLVSGHAPATASERALGVQLEPPPEAFARENPALASALSAGLALAAGDRPQSVHDFMHLLDGTTAPHTAGSRLQLATAPGATADPRNLTQPSHHEATMNAAAGPGWAAAGVSTAQAPPPARLRAQPGLADETRTARRRKTWIAGAAFVALGLALYSIAGYFNTHEGYEFREMIPLLGRMRGAASANKPVPPTTLENPVRTIKLVDYETPTITLFSRDGRRVVGFQDDGRIRIWNSQDGNLLSTAPTTEKRQAPVAVSSDGSLMAVSNKVTLFDVSYMTLPYMVTNHGDTPVAPEPVTLLASKDGRSMRTLQRYNAGPVTGALSDDGRMFAQGKPDGTIVITDVATGSITHRLPSPNAIRTGLGTGCIIFSRDRKLIAAAYSDKGIRIWDLKTRKNVRALFGSVETLISLAISPDGQQLMCADGWGVSSWNLKTGERLHPEFIPGPRLSHQGASSIVFSDDSERCAAIEMYSQSANQSTPQIVATVWDKNQKFVQACSLPSNYLGMVTFSNGHKELQGLGIDGTVAFWDVK